MDCFEPVVSLLALILAAISIVLLFIMECIRRPFLEFVQHKDEITPENESQGYMWYHLKVKNKEPWRWFNRDAAIECVARVTFVDKNTGRELVSQIETHWTNQPEPRNFPLCNSSDGKLVQIPVFDPTKIPTCQRKSVGFRTETFDILIKYAGDTGFYAANPWIVYCYSKGDSEYEKARVDVDECIARVEIEAINLGKKKQIEFILRNKGTKLDDIEIILLDC